MSKKIKETCPFTDEIVSYMYGEISGQAELEFETHLADCMVCTDEFAEASNARFSVYEWKKEVFDPLPTPGISVPYGEPTLAESYIGGFLAAIRAWAAGLSMPVAVAAGLALCVGIGLVVFSYLGRGERQVASNVAVPAVSVPDTPLPEAVKQFDDEKAAAPVTVPAAYRERAVKRPQRNIDRPVRSFAVDRKPTPQIRKAPVLAAYQDAEDDSLRLADLFDEVGG